jgi:hypothetical protein
VDTPRPCRLLVLALLLELFGCSQSSVATTWGSRMATSIPARPAVAITGSAFARATTGWSGARRQRAIEEQRGTQPLGQLTAGHKKDVVITNHMFSRPGRIAIYGWHRSNGDPIQPLSTIHAERYADYSHGVRLVLATISIGDREMSILEVLQNPKLAPLLTYEGVIREPQRLMQP